jgi:DNA-binding HxlR family transcriptional regulator
MGSSLFSLVLGATITAMADHSKYEFCTGRASRRGRKVDTMKSYGQFCPIAVACEVLTERWTPLVLRELLCGSRRFNDLRRGVPLMSPSLLSQRLKTLERAGIVERAGSGWCLTQAGEELRPIIETIGWWGQRWSRGLLDPSNLDASLLMWDIHRRVATENLPGRRVVVHVHLWGSRDKKDRFWLVLDGAETDLCLRDPGFEVDLYVSGHVRAMTRYWMGLAQMDDLVRAGELSLEGPRSLKQAFPSWFKRSLFAGADAIEAV